MPSPAKAYAPASSGLVLAFVPWYKVQKTLLDSLPAGTLELGHSLQSVDVAPGGVTLQFQGKPEVQAKLVIGADGNQSVVRQAVLGDGPPHFSNKAVWRGQTTVPAAWPYHDQRSSWFLGPAGSLIHAVQLGEGYMAWTVSLAWAPERVAELGSGRYIESAPTAASKLDRCLASLGVKWPSILLVRHCAGSRPCRCCNVAANSSSVAAG
jgi:2-polyprenyl-6-methoxyphenol hydroxylase-like FAD-dependent oxidoreductase